MIPTTTVNRRAGADRSLLLDRSLAVARMHLTDRLTLFGLPVAILIGSFVINLLIFLAEPVDARTTGGASAIYFVVLIAAVMCTARGLTFALGMGASRRAFALGTGLTGVLLAVVFGVVMFLLERLEVATGGWWMHGRFFEQSWYAGHNLAVVWLVLTLPFLAIFLLGAAASSVWLRWQTHGVQVGIVAGVLVVGGGAVAVTWFHAWGSIGNWFAGLSPLVACGWVALLCVPLAAASYLVLRRVAL